VSNHSFASIFPLPVIAFGSTLRESDLLIRESESIRIEAVSNLIQQTPSNFWINWSYDHGASETNRLRNTQFALVRRFKCSSSNEGLEIEKSKNLLYRLYLSLKVIRATKERFVVLHYKLGHQEPTVRDFWRNEIDSELLDCEFGFSIRPEELCELAQIAQQSLGILGNRTLPVTQATYSLEIGYRAEFFNVQHLLWVIGLEALFSSKERKHQGSDVVKRRVLHFLGNDFLIYPQQRDSELPRLIGISLRDALNEIFVLRHDFAHGTWPASRWAGKVCRPTALGTGYVNYSGMLLEAAAAILRGCLRKILADENLVVMFNEKKRMNAYFQELDIVRIEKPNKACR
jgi:hypothetical protein